MTGFRGGIRPGRAFSAVGVIAGIGIIIAAALTGLPEASPVFFAVFVLVGLSIVGYNFLNAVGARPPPVEEIELVSTGPRPMSLEEELRGLERLRRDGLLTEDEFQRKRREAVDRARP